MKKKLYNPMMNATIAALKKIAGTSLYQNEEKHAEKTDLIAQLGTALTANARMVQSVAPVETQSEKSTVQTAQKGKTEEVKKTSPAMIENGKVLVDMNALVAILKAVNLKAANEKKETKDEEQSENERIDWQATVKVMQSVATIALSMIEETEMIL